MSHISRKARKPKERSSVEVPPHPATLADAELLKDCKVEFGRGSGPGGQHRNKVETAVHIVHQPTGTVATASERRHQSQNRHQAVFRLRLRLALEVRREIDRRRYKPSNLWEERRQGTKMPVNPRHRDYPALLAEAMDVIVARDFDVAGAAGVLRISMSQLAKLIRHEKRALASVNDARKECGLHALR